ncbi:MAG: hypothetical protein PHS82_16745 [Lachnospiraceae bacterium]|nr:hypothetical protein [Lachnospiraceae bacterium]
MNKTIFREKTIDRVTSPEELNDYIQVTSPRIWIIIAIVLMLLAGTLCWGIFGSVEMQDDAGNTQEIHPITFIIN